MPDGGKARDVFSALNLTMAGVQARLFGVGGLIQAAVGLSGGVGAQKRLASSMQPQRLGKRC
jgi:hypothetical protein